MTWPKQITNHLTRLEHVEQRITSQYVGRETVVKLLKLSAICHEHFLIIGPPGTAKTEIILRFAELIDATSFHYLVTRFTEPSELFGPVDMKQFEQGVYRVCTDRMLPKAQIAFLDEIFNAGSPMLNALLGMLNERTYHNGAEVEHCPLITLVAATNHMSDDPWLSAFTDRFALRAIIEPTPNEKLGDLATFGWELEQNRIRSTAQRLAGKTAVRELAELKAADLSELHTCLAQVDLSPINNLYLDAIRQLRAEGVEFSDRRVVRSQKLIAGATLLRKAQVAEPQDFWPLLHCWTRPDQESALQNVLSPLLGESAETTSVRTIEDIKLDLDSFEHRMPERPSGPAISAHMRSLGDLRREILRDHSGQKTLLDRVEKMIHGGLSRLETAGT